MKYKHKRTIKSFNQKNKFRAVKKNPKNMFIKEKQEKYFKNNFKYRINF